MAEGNIRIGKAAKELGVGMSTIVEFLNEKGFDDIKPNSKLTQEMYNLLLEEYAADEEFRELADAKTKILQKKREELQAVAQQNVDEKFNRAKELDLEGVKSIGRIDLYNMLPLARRMGLSENRLETIINVIKNKGQLVLQGPPGTGKSYIATLLAKAISAERPENTKFIQFHESYTYEDFVEGITIDDLGSFKLRSGLFMNFCREASSKPEEQFCLVIDEINRANMTSVFGEALYLLENRESEIQLKHSMFSIPKNIYIIGTMNTADRSLDKMDFALRRRFSFYTISPNYDLLVSLLESNESKVDPRWLAKNLEKLNQMISEAPGLGEGFQIGISFFLNRSNFNLSDLEVIWEFELLPLLSDYFQEDAELIKESRNALFSGES